MLANLGSYRAASLAACLGISLFLAACASPFFDVGKTETVLPLSRAWFDGKRVDYVTTDISDSSMAQMMGANHVPGLAAALKLPPGSSILQRVYKFADEDQIGIFQSAPQPIGAANLDRSYSPLWRVVMVKWRDPANRRELKSEEELLAAEERGQVTLTITDIVINCPITRGVTGHALRGVR